MNLSQHFIGMHILFLVSILIQRNLAGCAKSKLGAQCSDSEHENDPGSAGQGVHEQTPSPDPFSGVQTPLPSTRLEFIIEKNFNVMGGEDECQQTCGDLVEKYQEGRFLYKSGYGPFTHDRCNLGWLRLGWRFQLTRLPAIFRNETIEPFFLEINKEVAGMHNTEALKERTLVKLGKLVSGRLNSALEELQGESDELTYLRGNVNLYCPNLEFEASTSAANHLFCHTTETMSLAGQMTDMFKQVIVDLLHTWFEAFRARIAGTQPDGNKQKGHAGRQKDKVVPSRCSCQIGIVVEHFLRDEDCLAAVFAGLFMQNQWSLRGPNDNYIQESVVDLFIAGNEHGEWERSISRTSLMVRAEYFRSLSAEVMSHVLIRPLKWTSTMIREEMDKLWFRSYTAYIRWNRFGQPSKAYYASIAGSYPNNPVPAQDLV
ncbi:hypothetical protein BCR37DRAFT_390072 [Protomyces lactucae-debilis]|uniref:Uncharacterized protein n=1 Tax=Protomyces lactucae-debilis TaxID=2754530 RepID=A0A1Y2ENQ6_PROLT|nr:uncharacterized protein BCR37DRAFT_390072 [Protomyces lactucae-debilis]ORY73203.1 hypothetical protein BCR37DRAFT_390072 [Protomyces lactucae-debilis]